MAKPTDNIKDVMLTGAGREVVRLLRENERLETALSEAKVLLWTFVDERVVPFSGAILNARYLEAVDSARVFLAAQEGKPWGGSWERG